MRTDDKGTSVGLDNICDSHHSAESRRQQEAQEASREAAPNVRHSEAETRQSDSECHGKPFRFELLKEESAEEPLLANGVQRGGQHDDQDRQRALGKQWPFPSVGVRMGTKATSGLVDAHSDHYRARDNAKGETGNNQHFLMTVNTP